MMFFVNEKCQKVQENKEEKCQKFKFVAINCPKLQKSFKQAGFHSIGATICTWRESQCLSYAFEKNIYSLVLNRLEKIAPKNNIENV